MRTMDTAPQDGTHILAKCEVQGYTGSKWERSGCVIEHIFWGERMGGVSEGWRAWCGKESIHSTYQPKPVGWEPLDLAAWELEDL